MLKPPSVLRATYNTAFFEWCTQITCINFPRMIDNAAVIFKCFICDGIKGVGLNKCPFLAIVSPQFLASRTSQPEMYFSWTPPPLALEKRMRLLEAFPSLGESYLESFQNQRLEKSYEISLPSAEFGDSWSEDSLLSKCLCSEEQHKEEPLFFYRLGTFARSSVLPGCTLLSSPLASAFVESW